MRKSRRKNITLAESLESLRVFLDSILKEPELDPATKDELQEALTLVSKSANREAQRPEPEPEPETTGDAY